MGGKGDRLHVAGYIVRIHVRILLLVLNWIELRLGHLGVPLHDPMLSSDLPLIHGRLRLLLVQLLLKSLLLPRHHELRVVCN